MGFNSDSPVIQLGEDVLENCGLLRKIIRQIEAASNMVAGQGIDPGEWDRERVRPCDLIHAVRQRVGPYHLGMFLTRTRDGDAEHWAQVITGLIPITPDDRNCRALADVGIIINENAPPYRGSSKILREALPGLLNSITRLLEVAEREPDSNLAPVLAQFAAEILEPIWAKFVEHHLVEPPPGDMGRR